MSERDETNIQIQLLAGGIQDLKEDINVIRFEVRDNKRAIDNLESIAPVVVKRTEAMREKFKDHASLMNSKHKTIESRVNRVEEKQTAQKAELADLKKQIEDIKLSNAQVTGRIEGREHAELTGSHKIHIQSEEKAAITRREKALLGAITALITVVSTLVSFLVSKLS